jgi:hypothetical protein
MIFSSNNLCILVSAPFGHVNCIYLLQWCRLFTFFVLSWTNLHLIWC